jgi:NAD(P)-dependent dehydrogenase (short-subunit alcohol dehydrogenase family)
MSGTTDIEAKVAVVTGASKGLGKALSGALARRGATVVMVARGGDELERAAEEVRRSGGKAIALAFDVADKEAVHRIAHLAAELGGEVDILVHNASTLGPVPMPLLFDLACEDLQTVIDVNLVGPFRLTKAIAGPMALRGAGTVVFVSSDAAVSAYPGWGAYGVTKAAADHLARSFAAELVEHGVRVFAVDPGEMDTEMHRAAIPDADPTTLARPERVAEIVARMIESPADAPSGRRFEAASWSAS